MIVEQLLSCMLVRRREPEERHDGRQPGSERHRLPLAAAPGGDRVHRRRRSGVRQARRGCRDHPQLRALHARGLLHGGARHHAELHLPQQHVHRHRAPGLGAWYFRQFLPRPRDERAGGDDRPRIAGGQLGDERIFAQAACASPRSPPRTSSAASSRRAWTSRAARSASPRSMPTAAPWRRTASRMRSASSASRCRTCIRRTSRCSCWTRA